MSEKITNFAFFRALRSPMDEEICRSIWDGKIACTITLNVSELAGILDAAEIHTLKLTPLCLFINRMSYLPLLLPQIRRHFSRWIGRLGFSPANSVDERLDFGRPWFSTRDGRPLHWHHPIGLLADIHSVGQDHFVPWSIQVNFTAYPAFPALLPFRDDDIAMMAVDEGSTGASTPSGHNANKANNHGIPYRTIQDYYYGSWKQADCLRWGSAKRTANLTKADQCQIWDAVWTRNFDRFWQVNRKVVGDSPLGQGDPPPTSPGVASPLQQQRIPVRCYLVDEQLNVSVKQWPIRLEKGVTVATILSSLNGTCAILHGLRLDANTPLDWLMLNCAYSDNFLHLVVLLSKNT